MNKNVIWGVIGAIVLIYAGYRLFSPSKDEVFIAKTFTAHGICFSCEVDQTVDYPREQRPPYNCAACGATQSVYLWWFCHDCHKRFIPALTDDVPPVPAPFVSCTGCACRHVEQYDPEYNPQAPVGDVPPRRQIEKWKRSRPG